MDAASTGGRYSVSFPKQWWYPACPSSDLGRRKPRSITLMETPLVVFRDASGAPSALLDRCPHRNVPLSMGRVKGDGTLECGYHGWCFDGGGRCTSVPGLLEGAEAESPTRNVAAHAAVERDGFVWVWGEADATPTREPLALPDLGSGPRVGQTVFAYDLDCTLHAALENALDVPHTAFLHAGIFCGGDQREITAVRRGLPDGLEVQYLGEPVGLGKVRAEQGAAKTFDHWDRFFLPSTAQVEYRVEGWLRIVNTILHLPMAPFRTRAWFVVRWTSPLPAAVAKPIVLARGRQILRQDAKVLARQTAHVQRMGGERYSSTDLDLVGTAIWRLLRAAERGGEGGVDVEERSVTLRV
jgi:phenylpropionate dioxygenase-like ring-hydroxylating dioxygenase large terminal subunit